MKHNSAAPNRGIAYWPLEREKLRSDWHCQSGSQSCSQAALQAVISLLFGGSDLPRSTHPGGCETLRRFSHFCPLCWSCSGSAPFSLPYTGASSSLYLLLMGVRCCRQVLALKTYSGSVSTLSAPGRREISLQSSICTKARLNTQAPHAGTRASFF